MYNSTVIYNTAVFSIFSMLHITRRLRAVLGLPNVGPSGITHLLVGYGQGYGIVKVFKENPHLVGWSGSGLRLVGRLRSGVRDNASFQIFCRSDLRGVYLQGGLFHGFS